MNSTHRTTGIVVVVAEGLNKTLFNGRKHILELERVLWGSSDFNKMSEFPEGCLCCSRGPVSALISKAPVLLDMQSFWGGSQILFLGLYFLGFWTLWPRKL